MRTMPTPADNLRTALSRYERLAAPPRHLTMPLVGSLDAAEHWLRRHLDTGRYDQAAELSVMVRAERRRIRLLGAWEGRSVWAWRAMRDRLTCARMEAVMSGYLASGSESWFFVQARIDDCKARVALCEQREQHGQPAMA